MVNVVETVYECDPDESLIAQSALVQDDGKAITMGMNGENVYILRRLPDGTLDPSFGNAGIVSETGIEIGYGGSDQTTGFWLEDNGRMLVCGRSGVVPGNGDDAILMALLPNHVGIHELSPHASLAIAPNPAHDHLNLTIESALNGKEARLELIAVSGVQVHVQVVPTLASNTVIALPASLPEGVYMLRIHTTQQQPRSARVVIQHSR